MSIDFTGGNPTDKTPVQDQGAGGKDSGNNSGADQGFIEYNGRKLSQEEVLKKLEHADTHIETLVAEREADQSRLSALEEAVGKANKIEDVLKALSGKEEPENKEPAPADKGNEVDLDTLLEQKLAQRDAARAAESNWKHVTGELAKAFGSKTNEKVAEVAADHDMTLEEAQTFAKSKPKAFLKLFGNLGSTTSTPSTPSYRNPAARLSDDSSNAPTGYMDAKTTKDQVSIYKRKLAQFGL